MPTVDGDRPGPLVANRAEGAPEASTRGSHYAIDRRRSAESTCLWRHNPHWMPRRDQLSQHEAAEELPLLAESAVVTDVAAMDHSRNDEVVTAIRETLDEYGSGRWREERPSTSADREEWIEAQLDPLDHLEGGTPLSEYLEDAFRGGAVGERLAALQARYLQPYPSLLRIVLETGEPVGFVAGQYLSLTYRDVTRVYSVANSPNREDLEFCVRRIPGGSLTSELAVDMAVGDEVTLRGPYGELVLEEPTTRDVVFLATGTGVAPFKGMIDYCFEEGLDEYRGEPRDVWLFLGAAWEDTLPYREVFEAYAAERENFHFVPTLSRESYLTDWDGETAYVQYALAKYLDESALADPALSPEFEAYLAETPPYDVDARLEPSSMEVYACGLTAMVESLVDAVDRMGVPPDRVQSEGFG